MLENVNAQYGKLEMDRLGKVLGFEVTDGIPRPLLDMPAEKLTELPEKWAKTGWRWTASGSRRLKTPMA